MMTKLQDLCSRLPYKPKCYCKSPEKDLIGKLQGIEGERIKVGGYYFNVEEVKPYLRSRESLSPAEKEELYNLQSQGLDSFEYCDWYCKHYVDQRYMINSGEAIEAPPGMYSV